MEFLIWLAVGVFWSPAFVGGGGKLWLCILLGYEQLEWQYKFGIYSWDSC